MSNDTQKVDILFKYSQGKSATNETQKYFEESLANRQYKLSNRIITGTIPSTSPGGTPQAGTPGVYVDVELIQTLTLSFIAGSLRSFNHSNLKNAIPFDHGDGSYLYYVTTSGAAKIEFGDGDWVVDTANGTLTFFSAFPTGVSDSTPPRISFYRYVGDFLDTTYRGQDAADGSNAAGSTLLVAGGTGDGSGAGGALTIIGGAADSGTGGNLIVYGGQSTSGADGIVLTQSHVELDPVGASAGDTGVLRFRELAATGTNYVGFKAPDQVDTNVEWTLPNTDGSAGQVISTDASGTLSWTDNLGNGGVNNIALNGTTATEISSRLLGSYLISISSNTSDWPASMFTIAKSAATSGTPSVSSLSSVSGTGSSVFNVSWGVSSGIEVIISNTSVDGNYSVMIIGGSGDLGAVTNNNQLDVDVSLTTTMIEISPALIGSFLITVNSTTADLPTTTMTFAKNNATGTPSPQFLAGTDGASGEKFEFQWDDSEGIKLRVDNASANDTYRVSIFGT
jgi:hypothetical protein